MVAVSLKNKTEVDRFILDSLCMRGPVIAVLLQIPLYVLDISDSH